MENNTPFVQVKELQVAYQRNQKKFLAVNKISFDLFRGKTLGLVGESGCGKSSTGMALLKLIPAQGEVIYEGREILHLSPSEFLPYRKKIQMIFQNPDSSLNPKLTIEASLSEALSLGHPDKKNQWKEICAERLKIVGLDPSYLSRYPHEFSGGQLQRIGIARALCVDPELLVCDEPVSSLDVSIQAQILELFEKIQANFNLTLLFISHDLRVVRYLSDHIAVMKEGEIVEYGEVTQVFQDPQHHYTKNLLRAVPEV